MTTREWLENLREGHVPNEPRAEQQLAALRKMALVERDERGYHLTPKGDELLNEWTRIA
jgi:Mn-dependent DtxR family transcriptional regulator